MNNENKSYGDPTQGTPALLGAALSHGRRCTLATPRITWLHAIRRSQTGSNKKIRPLVTLLACGSHGQVPWKKIKCRLPREPVEPPQRDPMGYRLLQMVNFVFGVLPSHAHRGHQPDHRDHIIAHHRRARLILVLRVKGASLPAAAAFPAGDQLGERSKPWAE